MSDPHTYILSLCDDEITPYGHIIRTLASKSYCTPGITEQVIGDLCQLASTDEPTARVVQHLIHMLHDDQSLPRLVAALQERSLCYPAGLLLGWFGPRAASALPALIHAVGWGPSIGIGAAATAILRIGDNPIALLDGLNHALDQANDDAFCQLVGLVAELELNTDARFIALLTDAAHNPNAVIRERTAELIGALPKAIQLHLGDVIKILQGDHDINVQHAINGAMQE